MVNHHDRDGDLGMAKPKHPWVRRSDIDRHVALRLRERRVVLGMSQQQLAEQIGFTYQQIHKYENSVNRIAAGILDQIARALGVEPGFFYEGLDEAPELADRPRALLSLAQDFARLDAATQRAVLRLSRVLADLDAEDAA